MARKTVRLKNGAVELSVFVASIMLVLDRLVEEKPVAALELVMKCRDSNYEFFGDNEKILQDRKLVEAGGTVHSSIRNIVLSAFKGDGFDMVLLSPIAAEG